MKQKLRIIFFTSSDDALCGYFIHTLGNNNNKARLFPKRYTNQQREQQPHKSFNSSASDSSSKGETFVDMCVPADVAVFRLLLAPGQQQRYSRYFQGGGDKRAVIT